MATSLEGFAQTLHPDWDLDEWARWPPDLFALTSLLLKATGAYRYAIDPPLTPWPQAGWQGLLDVAVRQWYRWMLYDQPRPELLTRNLAVLARGWTTFPIDRLRTLDDRKASGRQESWEVCQAILELHVLADEASTHSGFPIGSNSVWGDDRPQEMRALDYLVNMLLANHGTLSRLPREICAVLPKVHTPQVGLTLRSLSHHVTVHESEVEVRWRTMPWVNSDEDTVNVLVVPWPVRMEATWFAADPRTTNRESGEPHRYFSYLGDEKAPVGDKAEELIALLADAERLAHKVHVIVLPELSVTVPEMHEILHRIAQRDVPRDKVPMLIAGVRSGDSNRVVLATFFAGKWYLMFQDKHHRWKLDRAQIQQYGLAGILPVGRDWWEHIRIPKRRITFLAPNPWLLLCPLICEDLARLEPVSELIRGVGPTLLVAILMDGPQLRERWSGRYASVLADDPGTSVLSVSSLGMALRSKPRGLEAAPPRRTVALWKDRLGNWEALDLEGERGGVLLTVNASWVQEYSADGRGDNGRAAFLEFQGAQQIVAASREDAPRSNRPPPEEHRYVIGRSRDISDLTEFTYFVDAALETDLATLKRLELWAQGGDRDLPGWLPHFKLAEVADKIHSEAKTADNFDAFVRWGARWIRHHARPFGVRHLKDSEQQFLYWSRLVDGCKEVLCHVDIDSRTFWESVVPRWQRFTTSRRMPKSKCVRIRIYVALSVLWAVHNRLASKRSTKGLSPERAALLETIEKLLQKRPDESWYRAAGVFGEDISEGAWGGASNPEAGRQSGRPASPGDPQEGA
jgi:hypothetical protein